MTVIEVKGTFKLVCLGCRVNQYEIQSYRDQLNFLGYREITDPEVPCDLCIVNTCAVTGSAESSGRHAVRQVCRQNPGAFLVVTGCLGEADKEFFNSLDRQCLLVSNKEKHLLMEKIFPSIQDLPEFRIRSFSGKSRAFIKVQDGCNSFCSYCIIPYLRGRSRSRPVQEILEEISGLVTQGYREVVIAGINVGDYQDQGKSLAYLISQVDEIPGIERIRISSIDPEDVQDDLRDILLSGKHTCHSSHLVLQSGSNAILKRMNRKYSRGDFLDCVDALRSVDPQYAFTTDVIVGFPGETDQDFEETLRIVEDVGFIKVHIFPFSPRERTKAYTFSSQLPVSVINERKKHLAHVAREVAHREQMRRIGDTLSVLVERVDGGFAYGHSSYFDMVGFPADPSEVSVNTLIDVRIESVEEDVLKGKRV
ncbi:tRNA (N(6)-L-threonylcarbamoyladenosine(37)-C(2))-methylthiotransferase MtaB [Chlamydia psittaci]|uniref:tRNA (N(6)-L-threonylcarbamoyladenosine(37)-C(2))- methylthiotransferase MtaB n=1 Tax=Chlamydia psittaci TaxID=83554 RepID=UPI00027E1AB0|nr:tRNA (N(6)-L-threonylcarbamoyladenosine(37)-C(2))-methylthiotransferase MtaB [Chlamydia psittaci]AFS21203.1 RNA modification enzyme, MiaB family protein [Chlamydia psittaci MN]KPZ37340.1 threonylcarbamoyladenosine tRNA methylthiotransferase [Chlamydia psittaci CP3]KPZ39338.1 threonylcarbamoyladenosine tRNA methylthiotransferase [Chlamydia psittaci str. Frances]MBE3635715.1 tRNA (N(6)-L-threonylcarbamoyladenosine(37)-C(2))-methylthiotransferase MtaB [Chlamydia psittaci]BEU43951.1 tRNA (N(6)-